MAQPRRVLPGTRYLITRRCYQRIFRLRPSPQTNAIFKYCLALALAKTGVQLHAVCVMSNHHHLVVTDERGALPEFLRELHRTVAKAMNALQGESENLWAAEPCSAIALEDENDVIDTIAYVIANPVAAGLVEAPSEWPGLLAWDERVERVARPSSYFATDGSAPAVVTLCIERPAGANRASWLEGMRKAIGARVAAARHAILSAGKTFLGKARVAAQSVTARPRSREPRVGTVPAIAARGPEVRSASSAALRAFRRAYAFARERWCSGERDAVFPSGTWWMRVHHRARTAPLAVDAFQAIAG